MKGKQLSLWSKIAAAVFVLMAFVLSAVFKWGVPAWGYGPTLHVDSNQLLQI